MRNMHGSTRTYSKWTELHMRSMAAAGNAGVVDRMFGPQAKIVTATGKAGVVTVIAMIMT